MLTLEQFRQSGRDCADLGKELDFATETPISGRIYANYLYIEDTTSWPDGPMPNQKGRWYLLVDRDDYASDDLADLERRLFGWYLSENSDTGELMDDALNAAVKIIQDAIGVTTGDFAGVWFSGENGQKVKAILYAYLIAETLGERIVRYERD